MIKNLNKIVFASTNYNKYKEFSRIIKLKNTEIIFSDNEFEAPEESGTTFFENALIKAKYYSKKFLLPVISEDSGLCVKALDFKPGIFSSTYSGINNALENNKKLLNNLEDVKDRSCFYFCTHVFLRRFDDAFPVFTSSKWHGYIAKELAGKNGFGYDPIFIDLKSGLSAAEISFERKNTISHRYKSLKKLERKINKLNFNE